MASAGSYTMDSVGPHVTNCFPARSLFRSSNRGAGHWLMARRNFQDNRFQAVVYSASAEQKRGSHARKSPRRCRSSHSDRTGYTLDAALLMRTHHVKEPEDLCAVDVSDKNLTSARTEEFGQFSCVAYLNAAENALALESFQTFPALRELDLSMNGIHRIRVSPGEFPQLEVLDLSYNSVSPMDIAQLGALSRLRVLYLTGNGLTHLPVDLTVPAWKDVDMFPALEILQLDDNKLSHPAVFWSLAGMKSLRVLNLDNNTISAVPYLHESEAEAVGTVIGSMTQEPEESCQAAEETLHYTVLSNGKDSDRTEVVFHPTRIPPKYEPLLRPQDMTTASPSLPSFLLSSADPLPGSVTPPLPSLRTLSLANNKIRHEDDLLAVALFPSLEELVIYGNPLTTLRRGDPPLLGNFLQQRLGIQIIRKKSSGREKPHLIIPGKEKRKISTHVPKVPKQPLMIDSPPILKFPVHDSDIMDYAMSSLPLPPIRTSSEDLSDAPLEQSHESASSSSERGVSFSADPSIDSIFMTQVDNLDRFHESHPIITSPEADTTSNDLKEVPENFRGYEELLSVKADPDFIEPVGIQNNVRALEYALRHLLVYRDNKPRLHSVQKPYIPQERKVGNELGQLPKKKHRGEVLAEILTHMKEQRHLEEVHLESALRKGKTSREHKEAKRLLKELQTKYKFFHEEAAKRAIELEKSLRKSAKELLEAQNKLG